MSGQPNDGRTLRTRPLKTHPGWEQLEWIAPDGHLLGRQFRGPGGETISRRQYEKRLQAGEIPTIKIARGFMAQRAGRVVEGSLAATVPAGDLPAAVAGGVPPQPGTAAAYIAPPAAPMPPDPAPTLELPDASPASSRGVPAGVANAAELALAFTIAGLILTSLLALFTRLPELQLSDTEAQSIAVPAANIFQKSELNRRYGRYIAGSTDYSLLGYALYAYAHRVIGQLSQRQQYEAAQAAAQAQGRGGLYAVPTSQNPAAARPGAAAAPTGAILGPNGEPARGPARGGIAAAVAYQAANTVGFNPIPDARRPA